MPSKNYTEQTREILIQAGNMLADNSCTPQEVFEEVKKAHRLLSIASGFTRVDKDWIDASSYYRNLATGILNRLEFDFEIKEAGDTRLYSPIEAICGEKSYEQIMHF